MKYALNLADDGRILSVTYEQFAPADAVLVDDIPDGNTYEYYSSDDKKGKIKFHHHCVMCMRCTLFCPKDAVIFGLFASWKVNGRYDLEKIKSMDVDHKIITKDTE